MTKEELERKLRGPILKVEPMGSGVTQGKRLLTFPDGTQAIFKPALRRSGTPTSADPAAAAPRASRGAG